MTTVAGQEVTVTQASSTTYEKGTSSATASVVTNGATVLVLGMTNSTTITASQVIVQPPAGGGSPSYTPSAVVQFTQGSPSKAIKDGQVPTDYTEGSGTIVSGTAADKAAEVALATYPGGVVDRVVKLGNGEYEVHYIGVNWPHHVFVTSDYMVVGAY
jgi:archaellin